MQANLTKQGSLLVAGPTLNDPNFRRTVVYLLRHGEDGTIGVVLNRPGEILAASMLPEWASYVDSSAVYVGGPVEQDMPLCLATLRDGADPDEVPGLVGVHGPIVLVANGVDPAIVADKISDVRVFAGYAGWGDGQLAREMDSGDWMVLPAVPADVFAGPDVDLWAQVIRRQGLPVALLATYPVELQHN